MRKPITGPDRSRIKTEPRIEFYARSDDATIKTIPTGGHDAWLSLVVSGADREAVDANNLKVEINDRTVTPRYVGRVRPHFEQEVSLHPGPASDRVIYVEVAIPAGVASGTAQARVKLDSGETSPPFDLQMEEPRPIAPIIVTVRNGADYGTDIHARGPKSQLRLFVEGLNETANCENVRLKVGPHTVTPSFVGYATDIAGYRVDAGLPEGFGAGQTTLQLLFGEVASAKVPVEIVDK
jgi:hypothetical protein